MPMINPADVIRVTGKLPRSPLFLPKRRLRPTAPRRKPKRVQSCGKRWKRRPRSLRERMLGASGRWKDRGATDERTTLTRGEVWPLPC